MKETHIFYAPQIAEGSNELPADEAGHAVRVLRMREGDALTLTDGIGHFYDAHITVASAKHCTFAIDHEWDDHKLWQGSINLAVAPTKIWTAWSGLLKKPPKLELIKYHFSTVPILNDAW